MLDFLILVFFVGMLNGYGFEIAMFWTMVLAAVCLVVEKILGRELHPLQWLAYSTIFAFGIPSLIWDNPLIFQYKITILYGFFAVSLFLYPFFSKKTLVHIFFPDIFLEQAYLWVNRWLAVIFCTGAVANDLAIKFLTIEQWGIFKIFLIVIITILITLLFYYFLLKKAQQEEKDRIALSENDTKSRK